MPTSTPRDLRHMGAHLMNRELIGAEADSAEANAEHRPQALRPEVALPERLQARCTAALHHAWRTGCLW